MFGNLLNDLKKTREFHVIVSVHVWFFYQILFKDFLKLDYFAIC